MNERTNKAFRVFPADICDLKKQDPTEGSIILYWDASSPLDASKNTWGFRSDRQPCERSHLGDSGRKRKAMNCKAAGNAERANMKRHPWAKVMNIPPATPAKNCPPVKNKVFTVVHRPRDWNVVKESWYREISCTLPASPLFQSFLSFAHFPPTKKNAFRTDRQANMPLLLNAWPSKGQSLKCIVEKLWKRVQFRFPEWLFPPTGLVYSERERRKARRKWRRSWKWEKELGDRQKSWGIRWPGKTRRRFQPSH